MYDGDIQFVDDCIAISPIQFSVLMAPLHYNLKGQLISEGNYSVFKSLKKLTKIFEEFLPKANFLQEAMFFILCHCFFLHSPLFKSCCHKTFEYLSHCWDWASLLERAATAAASQQLTQLKFKFGWEALSTQQSCKKNWWQTNFKNLF